MRNKMTQPFQYQSLFSEVHFYYSYWWFHKQFSTYKAIQ